MMVNAGTDSMPFNEMSVLTTEREDGGLIKPFVPKLQQIEVSPRAFRVQQIEFSNQKSYFDLLPTPDLL